MSEGGLAEPGGAVEEEVVQRLVALLGGVDGDAEVILQLRLADELVEAPRAQRDVDLFVVLLRLAGDDALGCRWPASLECLCYLSDIIARAPGGNPPRTRLPMPVGFSG